MASKSEAELPDFSHPWKLSDLVLVVEEERFHVHKTILVFWSPVFEKMFTSEFQEKDKNEICLPDKKASEIKELLLQIYPSATERAITQENCYFLLKLAHEYQMEAIVTRCENVMVDKVNVKRPKNSIIADLVFAQTYKLEKLTLASVNQAQRLTLDDLEKDGMCDQIQPDNLKEIMRGIIKRLQRELNESRSRAYERQQKVEQTTKSIQLVKKTCLDEVLKMAKTLVEHASRKQNYSYIGCTDAKSYIAALSEDDDGHCCECKICKGKMICTRLGGVASSLHTIKFRIESLPS